MISLLDRFDVNRAQSAAHPEPGRATTCGHRARRTRSKLMGMDPTRLDPEDAKYLDDHLPERLKVRISDNIQPRCGCPGRGKRKGHWWGHWTQNPEPAPMNGTIAVMECLTCGAAWVWGEVCGQEPLEKKAAQDLGVRLTPEVAEFGRRFEAMVRLCPPDGTQGGE